MQTNSSQRVKSCRHSFEDISECVGSIHLLQPVLCCHKYINKQKCGPMPNGWPPCRIQLAPYVQCRKVWLTSTARVLCSNAAKTRNPLKFAGVPQIRHSPTDVSRQWAEVHHIVRHVEEVLLFNTFSPDCRYVLYLRRYSPTKLCDGADMAIFLRPVFTASRLQHVSRFRSAY